MPTYRFTQTMSTPGKVVTQTTEQSATSEAKIDGEVLAGNASQALFAIAFPVDRLKSIAMLCTQPCTIETNSTGSPDDTVQLAANVPLMWDDSQPDETKPFATDVTAFYVTNDSSPDTAGTLTVVALYDPTP